jgi:hypothetical protein
MANKKNKTKKLLLPAAHLHILKTAAPLITVAFLVGITYYTLHVVPVKYKTPVKIQVVSSTQHKKATAKPVPTPAPSPTPVVPAAPKPTPAPVATAVTTSSNPQPVVVAVPSSSVSNLTPAATPTPVPANSQAPTPTPTPVNNTSGYTSTNWSGYLATGAKFTTVSGSWKVPAVTGNGGSTSADSSWIGIGGVTAGDLIQVGTDNIVSSQGTVSTEAFYEILPAVSTTVPGMTVTADDIMTASIREVAAGQWSIQIVDTTTAQSFTISVAYSSSYSSAEWIEEDPSHSNGSLFALDYFSTTPFTNSRTTADGNSITATGANSQPITMVNSSSHAIATPSAIDGSGAGFSVTRN